MDSWHVKTVSGGSRGRTAQRDVRAACVAWLIAGLGAFTAPVAADTLANVTVESPREIQKLKKQVDAFVTSAITRPNVDDSLLRWNRAVCPLAAGLNRDMAEFVLTRLSQIAIDAHVPLGPQQCEPNLFIIVAKNPEAFLWLWWRRNHGLFNTRHGVAPVKHFIETPRPVRVFYNAALSGADNATLVAGMLAASTQGETADFPTFSGPSSLGSRVSFAVIRNISSAIIVIDPAQVRALNFGQLVDYVSLLGLMEVNLDKDLDEAPSILKVFAPSEAQPPAEMTAWDKALLQSLYATRQGSRVQLSEMETAMVKLLVPH